LLKLIRQTNPGAEIIVTYGAMATGLTETIQGCVEEYKMESADEKIDFYKFSTSIYEINNGIMCGHPSETAHKQFADELQKYILKKIDT
jgi:hypothetical protein